MFESSGRTLRKGRKTILMCTRPVLHKIYLVWGLLQIFMIRSCIRGLFSNDTPFHRQFKKCSEIFSGVGNNTWHMRKCHCYYLVSAYVSFCHLVCPICHSIEVLRHFITYSHILSCFNCNSAIYLIRRCCYHESFLCLLIGNNHFNHSLYDQEQSQLSQLFILTYFWMSLNSSKFGRERPGKTYEEISNTYYKVHVLM